MGFHRIFPDEPDEHDLEIPPHERFREDFDSPLFRRFNEDGTVKDEPEPQSDEDLLRGFLEETRSVH